MTARGRLFLDLLRTQTIPGDGALGTVLGPMLAGRQAERLNFSSPDAVRAVHRLYVEAGARVIETNTFAANAGRLGDNCADAEVADLNRLGVELAKAEAGESVFVAGAVGPICPTGLSATCQTSSDDEIRQQFRVPIRALADAGADVLMLETFSDLRQLRLALEIAKKETELPVVAQMAFDGRGRTVTGVSVVEASRFMERHGADVLGVNCGKGVKSGAEAAALMARLTDKPVSAFLNAGLPAFEDGEFTFGAPDDYMLDACEQLARAGLNLIGGCCGTTPEFVRKLALMLGGRAPAARSPLTPDAVEALRPARLVVAHEPEPPANSILDRLPNASAPNRRPLVVVELDPPRGLNYEPIVAKARQFREAGIDAITMADNPVATLHMGNVTLADIVQREVGLPVILHIACRDSNLLGLQSRLLEASARKINHVLALTGDPARVGDTPGASSVYDLNSFGLVELIKKFNEGKSYSGHDLGGKARFTIGVAFNPNGRNLAAVVDRLRRKAATGAHYALTQPIYDFLRYDQMVAMCRPIAMPIFAGIMPLLSERNAEYLHNEVPGIVLTDDARQRMKGISGKTGRAEGMKICRELIDHMMPTSPAFYIIPPQKFPDLGLELAQHVLESARLAAPLAS